MSDKTLGRPLRVLQVVEATLTGVGRHCLDLCAGLAGRGCEVHLIYSPVRLDRGVTRLLDGLRGVAGVNLFECPMQRSIGPWDLSSVLKVRRYLRKHGPFDVAHGHSSKGGAIVRLAAFGTSVQTVYTPNAIRTMNPQVSSVGKVVVGQIEKLLARVPGKIIAVSVEEQEHIRGLGIPAEKVALVPNGIEPQELPDKCAARQALRIHEEALVAGFVGRLSEQKALDVLIRSLPLFVDKVPDFKLAMIGEGEQGDELKALAETLGVSEHVLWLGQQPGFQSMPAFDIFVLPSRYEGLPYVLIEALMAGLPVVTTDLASSSMLVKSDVNGIVVPAESPEQLAKALQQCLEDDELRERFSTNAKERAEQFTLANMVDKTLSQYEQLTNVANTAPFPT